jgi:outer membrane protein OmpA-like peptidoglycan-associated protein
MSRKAGNRAVRMELQPMPQFLYRTLQIAAAGGAISILSFAVGGCTTKNYVRSQAAPIIQKTNELDDATAANNRSLHDVDQRAQSGIAQAQQSADSASQSAQTATQAAKQAHQQAQEAVNRADSLASVIFRLDTYKPISDVSVMFAFDKAELTRAGKSELDQLAGQLASKKSYILEITGGTDSVGSAEYNYDLSQRRASAVVQYLASKYQIPPHRFYLIGIGKDKEVATNRTAAGRAKNRRVEVQLLSNDDALAPATAAGSSTGSVSQTRAPQSTSVDGSHIQPARPAQ